MVSSVLSVVLFALVCIIHCGVATASSSSRFRQLSTSMVASPAAAQVPLVSTQCSSLYGFANAQANFNDSTKFRLSAEYPEDIGIYYGTDHYINSNYVYPINLVSTTYAYLGNGQVTVSDGAAGAFDNPVNLVLAKGDFINSVTVNYLTGVATGTVGAVYGLTFNTYCNCSASIGYFDGSISKTVTIANDWAVEYFIGYVATDSKSKQYIGAIGFCWLQQAPPSCPSNPCADFSFLSNDRPSEKRVQSEDQETTIDKGLD